MGRGVPNSVKILVVVTRLAALGLALLVSLIPLGCLAKGGITPPPQREDIPGTWIATEGNWAFLRLHLDKDGTGLLGTTFLSDSPMIYRVTSWQLTDTLRVEKGEPDRLRKLLIALEPVGNARPLELSGWAGKTQLKLRLAWEGWSPRWATFYMEAVMTNRAEQTRRAMETSVPQ